MYKKILIPLENSNADRAILEHIKPLAKLTGASLTLMHVADGWVARNFDQLNLAESDEIKTDRVYLQSVVTTLQDEGFEVTHSDVHSRTPFH
jgi:nucleotide-binding universal stress UspA family protein